MSKLSLTQLAPEKKLHSKHACVLMAPLQLAVVTNDVLIAL